MSWDVTTLRMGVTGGAPEASPGPGAPGRYVHLAGGLVSTLSGLAVPVLDASGELVGAIAIVLTMADVDLRVQVPVLLSAARGLSRMIEGRSI